MSRFFQFLFSITSLLLPFVLSNNFCGSGCVSVLPGMYCWLFASCVNHGHVVDFNGLISVNGTLGMEGTYSFDLLFGLLSSNVSPLLAL